jgi:hypothetical protein
MGRPSAATPALLSALLLLFATGCPATSRLPAPGRTLTREEPEHHRAYYLYVPSWYRTDRAWPLVVTCHGTPPFDTAPLQIDTWKGLAEREGFLLAAPELIGTANLPLPVEEQIQRQRDDERAILSVVRAVRASHLVEPSRIFLTCWSAGGYAALFTGLRNPDTFRALSVYQANFDPRFVEPCVPFLDRHQPVQVVYGYLDPIDDAQACVDWLRGQDFEPSIYQLPGSHQRNPEPMFEFFVDVVKTRPWIRVLVRDNPEDDMLVSFRTRTSFDPVRIQWDFGDGTGSDELTPAHRYAEPGNYAVRVALWMSEKRYDIRHLRLRIPRVRIGAATASAP